MGETARRRNAQRLRCMKIVPYTFRVFRVFRVSTYRVYFVPYRYNTCVTRKRNLLLDVSREIKRYFNVVLIRVKLLQVMRNSEIFISYLEENLRTFSLKPVLSLTMIVAVCQ